MTPDACGGLERGRCTTGHVCECHQGWAGPNCLAHRGRDPIIYDAPEEIADIGFRPPVPDAFRFLIVALGTLILFFVIAIRWKKYMEGWTPIPEADKAVIVNHSRSPSSIEC